MSFGSVSTTLYKDGKLVSVGPIRLMLPRYQEYTFEERRSCTATAKGTVFAGGGRLEWELTPSDLEKLAEMNAGGMLR